MQCIANDLSSSRLPATLSDQAALRRFHFASGTNLATAFLAC